MGMKIQLKAPQLTGQYKMIVLQFITIILIFYHPALTQPADILHIPDALPRSHSHNDYWNKHPLQDALALGFRSIEVDVHYFMNDLYVAHSILGFRWKATQLAKYSSIIHIFGLDYPAHKPVMVILSGNRPLQEMRAEEFRFAAYDGRVEDLNSNDPPSLIPMISEKWSKLFKWKGHGAFPDDEKLKLKRLVNEAHHKGRWLRFWATPGATEGNHLAIWKELYEAGVDFINTDDIHALHQFIESRFRTH